MAQSFSTLCFTGEEVIAFLDTDGDDGGMDDMFFPGSDDELGFLEEDEEEGDNEDQLRFVFIIIQNNYSE